MRLHSAAPPGAGQRLLRRAGGVDPRPVERAEVVALLRCGPRAASASEASRLRAPTRATRVARSASRKRPRKRTPSACGRPRASPLVPRLGEYRVDDGGMAGRERAARLVGDGGIDPRRHRRRIGRVRQPVVLVLAEQRLALERPSAAPPRPAPARGPAPARVPAPICRCRRARRPRPAAAAADPMKRRAQSKYLRALRSIAGLSPGCRPARAAPPSPWRGSPRASTGTAAAPPARRDPRCALLSCR